LVVFQQVIVQVKIDCDRHFRLCAVPHESISEAASIYVLMKLKDADRYGLLASDNVIFNESN